MVLYDHIYDVDNYFGEPYGELIDFFKNLPAKGKLLDVGCGQGRDAIALAKLGYNVSGIDISKIGIDYLNENAEKQNLAIKAFVADMFKFKMGANYDIILLDSILHFLKNDIQKEILLLEKIAEEIKSNGIVCICIWKSGKNEKILKQVFSNSGYSWNILNESYLNYTFKDQKSDYRMDIEYFMYIIQKNSIKYIAKK